jgi:hypothetical protein
MYLATIIGYISSVVWIFPIFRQYNTRIFYFFLVLGLSDPINLLCVLVFNFKTGLIHSIAALLLFYSLNLRYQKKIKISYTDLLVAVLFLTSIVFLSDLFYLVIAIHILIFARLVQIVIMPLHQKSELNIFYLILIFYEITVITKLSIYLSETYSGILFTYITLAFEVLIAIFFTVFKENNPRLTLKLK